MRKKAIQTYNLTHVYTLPGWEKFFRVLIINRISIVVFVVVFILLVLLDATHIGPVVYVVDKAGVLAWMLLPVVILWRAAGCLFRPYMLAFGPGGLMVPSGHFGHEYVEWEEFEGCSPYKGPCLGLHPRDVDALVAHHPKLKRVVLRNLRKGAKGVPPPPALLISLKTYEKHEELELDEVRRKIQRYLPSGKIEKGQFVHVSRSEWQAYASGL